MRISHVARSADWVAAQYASMNDAFVTFGGEESAPVVDGVLANDSDVDDVNLTAVLVSGPTNAASFAFNADGSFEYYPSGNNPLFIGTYSVEGDLVTSENPAETNPDCIGPATYQWFFDGERLTRALGGG